jgi:hypothetical protein
VARDSDIADDYDEDFDEDLEEDIGGDDDAPAAPAKPPTPEPPKPAARAGRRAGASAAVSAAVNPLGEFDSGGKRLPEPVSNGWAERAGLQEQERQRQEKLVSDARAEALRLERLEERKKEEEEERRREDEEVERRMAAAGRRKEEAAQRQRDADADRKAMASGSFLTSVDLPDSVSAGAVVNPQAKEPHRRTKPPPVLDSRKPPAKPARPAPIADNNLVDALVSERERMADLARENAQLEAELGKVRREVDRVRKETQMLHCKAGPPRSAGAMRPVSKQGGRGARRPPSTADAERELRLAHNARRQLEYYAKEHQQLQRQVSACACSFIRGTFCRPPNKEAPKNRFARAWGFKEMGLGLTAPAAGERCPARRTPAAAGPACPPRTTRRQEAHHAPPGHHPHPHSHPEFTRKAQSSPGGDSGASQAADMHRDAPHTHIRTA